MLAAHFLMTGGMALWLMWVCIIALGIAGLTFRFVRARATRRLESAGNDPSPERWRLLQPATGNRPRTVHQTVVNTRGSVSTPVKNVPAVRPQAARIWARPPNGNPAERRRSLRRQGNPVTVRVTDAETLTPPYEGTVFDRSTGGLCLRVSNPVPPGTILCVLPIHAPEGLPWVRVMVRSCRPAAELWALGCEFIEELPLSVLLLFG